MNKCSVKHSCSKQKKLLCLTSRHGYNGIIVSVGRDGKRHDQTLTKRSLLSHNNDIKQKQIEPRGKVHLAVNFKWLARQSSIKIWGYLSSFLKETSYA